MWGERGATCGEKGGRVGELKNTCLRPDSVHSERLSAASASSIPSSQPAQTIGPPNPWTTYLSLSQCQRRRASSGAHPLSSGSASLEGTIIALKK